MALVRIYQKPTGTPANSSVFAVEIQQNNIWYTKKVSWEDLKGLIAGATSLVFNNGTVTFTTPDGVAHEVLSVDDEVLAASGNPVTGGAVSTALAGKQDTLTFDQVPTDGSTNPVESNGIFDALAGKQDTLTFDTTPTDGSTNPVTSAGIYTAISAITTGIDWKEAVPTYADIATTYPNPQDGWTVTTLDDDHTYRYTGTEWVDLFSLITLATSTKDGLMSSSDFTKLSGIEAQANKTVVSDTLAPSTTTKKLATVSGGGTSKDILGDDADKILRAAFGEHTVSGNPVSADAFLGLEVPSECKVTMNPIQDLSHGEPSPTNICPISGRTEASLYQGNGINQWDEEWEVGTLSTANGQPSDSNNYIRSKNFNEIDANTSYCLVHGNHQLVILYYNANYQYLNYEASSASDIFKVVTSVNNAKYFKIRYGDSSGVQSYDNSISVNYPSTVTSYEPHIKQTYTHQYGQTVYGGVDDFVNGGLDNEYDLFEPTTVTIVAQSSGLWYWAFSLPKTSTNQLSTNGLMSSHFNPTNQVFAIGNCYITANGTLAACVPSDQTLNTGALVNAWLAEHDLQFAYKPITPTTIETSADNISLLKGNNVLSTDGDNLELKYSADIKAYIDSKLNA